MFSPVVNKASAFFLASFASRLAFSVLFYFIRVSYLLSFGLNFLIYSPKPKEFLEPWEPSEAVLIAFSVFLRRF